MPDFSEKSIAKLTTCNARLQRMFHEVVRNFDCTVIVRDLIAWVIINTSSTNISR